MTLANGNILVKEGTTNEAGVAIECQRRFKVEESYYGWDGNKQVIIAKLSVIE